MAKKHSEKNFPHSSEHSQLIEGVINDGIWDWDVEKDTFYYSSRWCDIVGFSKSVKELVFLSWFDRVHDEDRSDVHKIIKKCRLEKEQKVWEFECRIMHYGGYYLWVYNRVVAVRNKKGEVVRIVGAITNISDYKIAHGQLVHGVVRDKLTGLPNRTKLMEKLENAIEEFSVDDGASYALLFLDLDRFKFINDSLGHDVGDQFIKKIAKRLQVYEGPGDLLARIGGDEFVLLIRSVEHVAQVRNTAEGVLKIVSLPIIMEERKLYASASIGIVFSKKFDVTPSEVVKNAETAMYKAKSRGRARYELFESGMSEDANKMLTYDHELRRALDEGQFRLHYQPVISMQNDCLIGFEALIRWQHPQRGLLSPSDFIEIAEQTGFIVQIGDWVLQEATEQYMRWEKLGYGGLHIAVNFSASQLEQTKMLATIDHALKKSGMPAKHLYVEVTESSAMDDFEVNSKLLTSLSDMGLKILIDDFGTGYSSLSYLKRLPFNILKIDKSFVDEVPNNSDSIAIIEAIIAMAHKLKLNIIAEGVETKEQYDFLKANGCDFIQGYYFYKPLSEEEATQLLSELKKNGLDLSHFGRENGKL